MSFLKGLLTGSYDEQCFSPFPFRVTVSEKKCIINMLKKVSDSVLNLTKVYNKLIALNEER